MLFFELRMWIILTILGLISAFIAIYSYKKYSQVFFIFKPLTTILIIAIASLSGLDNSYSLAIFIGLIFSLLGDIFLVFKSKFIWGLISFLIAHIVYTKAFYSGFSGLGIFIALPLLIYAAIMLFQLWSGAGKLKIPILIYISAILLMTYQSAEMFLAFKQTGTILAFVGALFFTFSDSVLAINRFKKEFKGAQVLTLSSYYLAQWLIASSTLY